jgi:hypothetical protein
LNLITQNGANKCIDLRTTIEFVFFLQKMRQKVLIRRYKRQENVKFTFQQIRVCPWTVLVSRLGAILETDTKLGTDRERKEIGKRKGTGSKRQTESLKPMQKKNLKELNRERQPF